MASYNIPITCSAIAFFFLNACGQVQPKNIEPAIDGGAYQAQYRLPPATRNAQPFLQSATLNEQKCLPRRGGSSAKAGSLSGSVLAGERLSRNDLLDVRIGDDDTFTGSYVISRDGMLKLPFLAPIQAQGRSTGNVETAIERALVADGFYEALPRISVRVADFASVKVGVTGAVFEARPVEIGGVPGDSVDARRQAALGSSTEGRNLTVALQAAGGVRPDADLSAVEIRRGGKVYKLDLRGVLEGRDDGDVMLLTGDEVTVPSRQCFQDDLMKPSPVSPPGVSLFLSNLTQPAAGNAGASVGRDVREIPYGTRYLQAVIDTNCVGGSRSTSAGRSAVLFSRNPLTKVSVVVERDIEDLLRRADRDDYDPYLLPGDAVACYDSTVTNIAEIGRVLGIVGAGLALR